MLRTLIDMFLEQVGSNQERKAVLDCHGAYTYGQLNLRSAILAKHLLDKRQALKTEGKRIALLLPRSRDFLVAMLGILRAGCAAVPLDSEYHAGRINTILEDVGCSLCISIGEMASKLKAASLLNLDEIPQKYGNQEELRSLRRKGMRLAGGIAVSFPDLSVHRDYLLQLILFHGVGAGVAVFDYLAVQ